jgi:hypothetical protein
MVPAGGAGPKRRVARLINQTIRWPRLLFSGACASQSRSCSSSMALPRPRRLGYCRIRSERPQHAPPDQTKNCPLKRGRSNDTPAVLPAFAVDEEEYMASLLGILYERALGLP